MDRMKQEIQLLQKKSTVSSEMKVLKDLMTKVEERDRTIIQ